MNLLNRDFFKEIFNDESLIELLNLTENEFSSKKREIFNQQKQKFSDVKSEKQQFKKYITDKYNDLLKEQNMALYFAEFDHTIENNTNTLSFKIPTSGYSTKDIQVIEVPGGVCILFEVTEESSKHWMHQEFYDNYFLALRYPTEKFKQLETPIPDLVKASVNNGILRIQLDTDFLNKKEYKPEWETNIPIM
jgi:HSP20 family molecular chaperone IbpA